VRPFLLEHNHFGRREPPKEVMVGGAITPPWGFGAPPPGTTTVGPYMGPGTAVDPYSGRRY
jgi:hypothetical protein